MKMIAKREFQIRNLPVASIGGTVVAARHAVQDLPFDHDCSCFDSSGLRPSTMQQGISVTVRYYCGVASFLFASSVDRCRLLEIAASVRKF